MAELDAAACYRALRARDRRFDGVFFVGVATTGIYCRPVCPARTPAAARCRFFVRAAEAERAGFRACFRCRPERAPGDAAADAKSRLVRLALGRIGAGALDSISVDALASELGVTARHLRRAVEAETGVTPIELAQTRRLGIAKWLIQDTELPLTEVAFASGYASIRRFNKSFSDRFGRPPSTLRRERSPSPASSGVIELRLETRAPFAAQPLLEFLRARAVPGVEEVTNDRYRRMVYLGKCAGSLEVRFDSGRADVVALLDPALVPVLSEVVARLRALFDLDARPDLIDAHLGGDPLLAPLIARTPGLRVPGAFDGWELAVRAVLGQQVSVRAATTLAGRLVERFARGPGRFPSARQLGRRSPAEIAAIGLPQARAQSIALLARAVAAGELVLRPSGDETALGAELQRVPGIGPWTASYVALRALRSPDAFLPDDLGVKKALGVARAEDALRIAERFRPWRAYALMHLWRSLAAGG